MDYGFWAMGRPSPPCLHADLAEEHGGEEADVPGDHVQPELVVDAGALGEVGQVLADGVGERGCGIGCAR